MDISLIKKDLQARFWTVPGPFFIFCILLSIALNSTFTPLILPLIAIVGAIVCNLWKWRGVACASTFLALGMIYALQSQASQSWIWIIALSLSIATTFIITALCTEEAYHSWDKLSKGTIDHKQAISHLNECYQAAQQKFASQQNEYHLKINDLEQQLAIREEKQRSNEQLIRLAKSEIASVLSNQKHLEQSLQNERQKNAELSIRLQEKEGKDHEGMSIAAFDSLQEKIAIQSAETERLEAQLEEFQLREGIAAQKAEDLSKEITSLNEKHLAEEGRFSEFQVSSAKTIGQLEKLLDEIRLEVRKERQNYEAAFAQKEALEKSLLLLQEEFEVLSQQDQEKQKCLETLQEQQKGLEENLLVEHEKLLRLQKEQQDILNQKHQELDVLSNRDKEKEKHIEDLQLQQKELQEKFSAQQEILKQKTEELEEVAYQDEEKQNHIFALEVQQKELQEKLLNEKEILKQKLEELDELSYHDEKKQIQIDVLQVQQKELQENLLNEHRKFVQFQEEQQEILKQKIDCIDLVKHEKGLLLEQIKLLENDQKEKPETTVDLREWRRLEGMYIQLKQQFAEKSDVLTQTRRELFSTQEKLLAVHIEHEETKIDHDREIAEALHKIIAEVEGELLLVEGEHAIEVHHLHELIGVLMKEE